MFSVPRDDESALVSVGVHGLPARAGKLKDLTRFDNTFFGIHEKQANNTDPQLRMLMEVTYEAICDAGERQLLIIHSSIYSTYCIVYL